MITGIPKAQTLASNPVVKIQEFKSPVITISIARNEHGNRDRLDHGVRIECQGQRMTRAGVAPFLAIYAGFVHKIFLLVVLECIRQRVPARTQSCERQLVQGLWCVVMLRRKGGCREEGSHPEASAPPEFRPTVPQDSLLLRTTRDGVLTTQPSPQNRPNSIRAECWLASFRNTRANALHGSSTLGTPPLPDPRVRYEPRSLPANPHDL